VNFHKRQGIMKFAYVLAAGFLLAGVAGGAPVKASNSDRYYFVHR